MAEESTPRPRDSQGRFLSQEETEEHPEATEQQPAAETEISEQPAETEISEPPPSDAYAPTEAGETQPSASQPEDDQANRLDAMGLDKRRQVVGQSYGASLGKQAAIYGAFLVVLVALVFGGKLLADKLDQPPEKNDDVAPWSAPDAPQIPPRPLQ